PSGEQIEITFGDESAVITEVGATLRTYDKAGVGIVEGFAPHEIPSACRNQICYPWVNRVGSGEWSYSGRRAQVGADNVVSRTLNHGLVRWRPFAIDVVEPSRCALSYVLFPTPDYPFATRFGVDYSLDVNGLTVTSTVTNVDGVDVPFSLGFHPYFAPTTPTIDGTRLHLPARSYLEVDGRMLPTGAVKAVVDTPYDFRESRAVDGVALDVTYTDLARDESGLFTVTMQDAHGVTTRLSQDEAFAYFQVFSADTLARGRRRTSLALEPMTAPAEAFRSHRGLLTLAPSQSWSGVWRVQRDA
ncbi:MAG: aldose epimerase, partial [Acidobacteria bacterium]|nr:aldose epimerase [Acidobacteriota bacterium]